MHTRLSPPATPPHLPIHTHACSIHKCLCVPCAVLRQLLFPRLWGLVCPPRALQPPRRFLSHIHLHASLLPPVDCGCRYRGGRRERLIELLVLLRAVGQLATIEEARYHTRMQVPKRRPFVLRSGRPEGGERERAATKKKSALISLHLRCAGLCARVLRVALEAHSDMPVSGCVRASLCVSRRTTSPSCGVPPQDCGLAVL